MFCLLIIDGKAFYFLGKNDSIAMQISLHFRFDQNMEKLYELLRNITIRCPLITLISHEEEEVSQLS